MAVFTSQSQIVLTWDLSNRHNENNIASENGSGQSEYGKRTDVMDANNRGAKTTMLPCKKQVYLEEGEDEC